MTISDQTSKSQTELREKILERIDFLSEHWIMGDDRPPFSFGGWRDEVADALVDIFDKALTDQHNKTLEEVGQAVRYKVLTAPLYGVPSFFHERLDKVLQTLHKGGGR